MKKFIRGFLIMCLGIYMFAYPYGEKEKNKVEQTYESGEVVEANGEKENNIEEKNTEEKKDDNGEKTQGENEAEKIQSEKDKQIKEEKPKEDVKDKDEDETLEYKEYHNKRFGFSMQYPSFFTEEEIGLNNEGKTVMTKDSKAKLSLFGANNISGETAKEMLNNDIEYLGKNTFKRLAGNTYRISWSHEEKIYYKMVKVSKGSTAGFLIEYPKSEKKKYDEVIDRLCKTFKAGNLNIQH